MAVLLWLTICLIYVLSKTTKVGFHLRTLSIYLRRTEFEFQTVTDFEFETEFEIEFEFFGNISPESVITEILCLRISLILRLFLGIVVFLRISWNVGPVLTLLKRGDFLSI